MKTPEIITHYLDAANRCDVDGAADCFSADARVYDEKHHYVGRDAVREWIDETTRKYRPHVEVLTTKAQGEEILIAVQVAGSFPGSPIELNYAITLRDGQISSLKIE